MCDWVKVHGTILADQITLSQFYYQPAFSVDVKVEVSDLKCVQGFITIFSDLDLSVSSGTALQIAGANGCGKTSLLRTIATLSEPENGEVIWNEISVDNDAISFHSNLTYLGHRIGLNNLLSPRENLQFLGNIGKYPSIGTVEQYLELMSISDLAETPCYQLSAGQQQRVALARVLRSNTQLWILDEPATALDSAGILLLEQFMQTQLKAGGIIIYASHQKFDLGDVNHRSHKLNQRLN